VTAVWQPATRDVVGLVEREASWVRRPARREHDDQPTHPAAVDTVAGSARDGDDLLASRWICVGCGSHASSRGMVLSQVCDGSSGLRGLGSRRSSSGIEAPRQTRNPSASLEMCQSEARSGRSRSVDPARSPGGSAGGSHGSAGDAPVLKLRGATRCLASGFASGMCGARRARVHARRACRRQAPRTPSAIGFTAGSLRGRGPRAGQHGGFPRRR
jgi:hypothetical protein